VHGCEMLINYFTLNIRQGLCSLSDVSLYITHFYKLWFLYLSPAPLRFLLPDNHHPHHQHHGQEHRAEEARLLCTTHIYLFHLSQLIQWLQPQFWSKLLSLDTDK
jgi:hypothetical protein